MGLNSFNQNTNTFIRYNSDQRNPDLLTGRFITSIYQDSADKKGLWIGSYDGGLDLYNSESNLFDRYLQQDVMTLYKDRSGILWIGTFASGVKTFDKRKYKFNHRYVDPKNPDDLNGNMVSSILIDRDKDLWVGTWGNGVKIFDKQKRRITKYNFQPNNNSIADNHIYGMCESLNGKIWIATRSKGLYSFDKKTGKLMLYKFDPENFNSIRSDGVSALYFDKQSNILWIGYTAGGISSYNISNDIFTHYIPNEKDPLAISGSTVTTMYKGEKTGLWIGTSRNGLNNLNLQTNRISHYQSFTETDSTDNGITKTGSLNSNTIGSIYEDDQGIVWIGTNGGGLNRYDPKSNSFTYFTAKDGLPNNVIYGILSDKSGHLWISTNKGLSRFDPITNKFKNFDVNDGLQSNEFNLGAYFESADGELFFGGVHGFNSFFPEKIKDNPYIPPVYLTTFKVFDKELSLSNPLTNDTRIVLSYSQNFFSFEFAALNYTAPQKNQYAYMLEGFDNNYHFVPASNRFASYTNLDPGEYILKIKGSNNDDIWNESGTSIILVITPPFWMTVWFRIIVVILILIIFISVLRHYMMKPIKEKMRRMEQETILERERLRISRDMHDDLGSRLTEIRLLSEMAVNDPEIKAVNVLKEVSEAAKSIITTFGEIVWSVNPQNDSAENLAEYIGQYSAEYLSKMHIRCRVKFPGEFPHSTLSSETRHNIYLAVKEALNNAVKYSGTDEIHLTVEVENSSLIFIIKDFGKGFESKEMSRSGNGFRNMRKRLEQIGGIFEFETGIGKGTTIRFSIPIEKVT